MSDMQNTAKRFWLSKTAATTTEYAIMSALIIVVALASVALFGSELKHIYSGVQSTIASTQNGFSYSTSK